MNYQTFEDSAPTKEDSKVEKVVTCEKHPQLVDQKWTVYLGFCQVAIIIGTCFMHGYNSSVVNTPFAVLTGYINETHYDNNGKYLNDNELTSTWTIVVSLYVVGGIVGSTWFPNVLVKRCGKKKALFVPAIIGVTGSIILFITPWTNSYIPLFVGRALLGIQAGLALVIAPGLILEHAPVRLQGACSGLIGLFMAIGIIAANFLGLEFIIGNSSSWQYLFLIMLVLFVLHGFSLFFVVESPRWLIEQGRDDDAKTALVKLRGVEINDVTAEFENIKKQLADAANIKTSSLADILERRDLWWPLVLVVQLHISNQLTGRSAVFFYATKVMTDAGLDHEIASLANLGLSVVMLIAIFFNIAIVERVGRRPLMIAGVGGQGIANIMLVIVLHYNIFEASIVGFAIFLVSFAIGPGTVPYYMAGELIVPSARSLSFAIGMFTNWAGQIAVSFAFPQMQLTIGEYSFLPLAVVALIECVFLLIFLPETGSNLVDHRPDFSEDKLLIQLKKR